MLLVREPLPKKCNINPLFLALWRNWDNLKYTCKLWSSKLSPTKFFFTLVAGLYYVLGNPKTENSIFQHAIKKQSNLNSITRQSFLIIQRALNPMFFFRNMHTSVEFSNLMWIHVLSLLPMQINGNIDSVRAGPKVQNYPRFSAKSWNAKQRCTFHYFFIGHHCEFLELK